MQILTSGRSRNRSIMACATPATAVVAVLMLCLLVLAPAASAAPGPWVFVTQAASAHSPEGRVFGAAAGAVDGRSGVFYGGQVPGGDSQSAFADTWVNSAAGWTPKCGTTLAGATAPCGPGPRVAQGMATGPGAVLLYGGFSGQFGNGAPSADMWRWTGTTWAQVCATCDPGPRALAAMTGNGTQVVLYGGLGGSGSLQDDTWVYDGASWTRTCGPAPAPACGPGGLGGASMAWDGMHFVLFGGTTAVDNATSPAADTWIFDGVRWTKACGSAPASPCGPAGRVFGAFAYAHDNPGGISGAVLAEGGNLFGSPTVTLYRDAWLWHANAWTQLDTPWSGTPISFPGEAGGPPPGPDPLIGLLAAEPAVCGLVYLGTRPTGTANPAQQYTSDTFTGGRNRTGAVAPGGCAAPPVTSTSAAPSSGGPSSSAPSATTSTRHVAAAPRSSTEVIAATGPANVRPLIIIGVGLLIAGGAVLTLARNRPIRPRRR